MSYDFQTTTHGKWILAGEHAVLRGHGALVFPIQEKKLILSYKASTDPLRIDCEKNKYGDLSLLLRKVLEEAQRQYGLSSTLEGHFYLYNDIPIGVGLGASAALCVAVAQWFETYYELPESPYAFAKNLEHLFHGKSSGIDIAGVASTQGMYFSADQLTPINATWKPHWLLSSCTEVGITAACVNQVQQLWEHNPEKAAAIDQMMSLSVIQAREALENSYQEYSLSILAKAMQQATECFKKWELISKPLEQHIEELYNQGALAVKPTGSGKGGYVVSLWKNPPSALANFIIA